MLSAKVPRRKVKRQFRLTLDENSRYSKLARDRGMKFSKFVRQLFEAEIQRSSSEGKAA